MQTKKDRFLTMGKNFNFIKYLWSGRFAWPITGKTVILQKQQ